MAAKRKLGTGTGVNQRELKRQLLDNKDATQSSHVAQYLVL